jgi:REP element-mobilizing transposase RayT
MRSVQKHRHLKRLDRVWLDALVIFVTVCTHGRQCILANRDIENILINEWRVATEKHGWRVGRYVIMPDHVHFFCMEVLGGARRDLSRFMQQWKKWTAVTIQSGCGVSLPVWQRGFFDHVLRNDESWSEKWDYVRQNPVRAGLVENWEEWQYQGWIDFDQPIDQE